MFNTMARYAQEEKQQMHEGQEILVEFKIVGDTPRGVTTLPIVITMIIQVPTKNYVVRKHELPLRTAGFAWLFNSWR